MGLGAAFIAHKIGELTKEEGLDEGYGRIVS
jgi:hypothetical protein